MIDWFGRAAQSLEALGRCIPNTETERMQLQRKMLDSVYQFVTSMPTNLRLTQELNEIGSKKIQLRQMIDKAKLQLAEDEMREQVLCNFFAIKAHQ